MRPRPGPCAALLVLAAAGAGCRSQFQGGGELRAERVLLKHEVEGLRQAVGRLERGEPLLPPGDVAIGIDDRLLHDLIAAQLPFEADVDRFHVSLTEAEVQFRGSPLVKLHGSVFVKEQPSISAVVNAIGALEQIQVDPGSGTLHARISVDHIGIESAAGLESVLSGSTLDELARSLRLRIAGQLPAVQIPVRVQQAVVLPALTQGPVRLGAASMPLEVTVSRAYAGQGMLWIGVHIRPGDLVKSSATANAGAGR
jgi:hypothetical protein